MGRCSGAETYSAPQHKVPRGTIVRNLHHLVQTRRRSLTGLCEIRQSLRGGFRAKFCGLLVPLARLCNIGLDADGAELMEEKRVKTLSKHQCGIGAAGFGGTPQQNPRRSEIAVFEKIIAPAEERSDLISAERTGRRLRFHRRRLGDRGLPGLSAGDL